MRWNSQDEPDDRKLDRIVDAAINATAHGYEDPISADRLGAAIRAEWALTPVIEPFVDWWYPERRPRNQSSCVHVILRSADPYKVPDRFGPYWEWRIDLEIWNPSMDYYGEGTLTDQYPTSDLTDACRHIEGGLMIMARTGTTAGAAEAWHEYAATLTPPETGQ